MDSQGKTGTMRAVRFHDYGEPTNVLRLEEAEIPGPGAGRIRVRVHACGLNPADWGLCQGLFAGSLPRGIELEVSGKVDALGEGVGDVAMGDLVLGTPDFTGYASAGASDYAITGSLDAGSAGPRPCRSRRAANGGRDGVSHP